jgi:DNA-binding IclR family transcriptional regulator
VISKVVALLAAFSPVSPELSLNALAALTGLPVSTTYRLASELVAWGGLERAERGGYRIGLRLWEIGSLAPRGETLREVALPYMHDLYEATHENVHLAVLDGTEALYVEKLSGRRAMPVRTRRGGRLPLHATAVGKVLLAYGPESLFLEAVATGLHRYTAHTIIAPGHLRRTLTEIRRTGIAYAREELTVGTLSLAVVACETVSSPVSPSAIGGSDTPLTSASADDATRPSLTAMGSRPDMAAAAKPGEGCFLRFYFLQQRLFYLNWNL